MQVASETSKVHFLAAELERNFNYEDAKKAWDEAAQSAINPMDLEYFKNRSSFCSIWGFKFSSAKNKLKAN